MTKSVQSLRIVLPPLISAVISKVVRMIRVSMPTCLVSVLALVFQRVLVFFVSKVGVFLVMLTNFFNYENNRFNCEKSESVKRNAKYGIAE